MRIATPGAVYRSVDPDHLVRARTNETARDACLALAAEYAQKIHPNADMFGRHFDDGGIWFTGISVPYDFAPPEGWRIDTKTQAKHGRVLTPRKKDERGKAIANEMKDLSFSPKPLGAVSSVVLVTDGENRWFSQGVIEVIGGKVFAEYHHPIDDRPNGKNPSDRARVEADPGWEPCPLSEFYAAREQVAT